MLSHYVSACLGQRSEHKSLNSVFTAEEVRGIVIPGTPGTGTLEDGSKLRGQHRQSLDWVVAELISRISIRTRVEDRMEALAGKGETRVQKVTI